MKMESLYHLYIFTESTKPWGASNDLAFRVRSTVCRGPDDRAVATQVDFNVPHTKTCLCNIQNFFHMLKKIKNFSGKFLIFFFFFFFFLLKT